MPAITVVAATSTGLSLDDWKNVITICGTLIGVPSVIFASFKTWQELKGLRRQRQAAIEQQTREQTLKRAEFTLTQHRRLFEDVVLVDVIRRLDRKDPELGDEAFAEAKRRFLTFFEELILLVNSGYVAPQTAFYMFGYYAACANRSELFRQGIAYEPRYWGLFIKFAENADHYLRYATGPDVEDLKI